MAASKGLLEVQPHRVHIVLLSFLATKFDTLCAKVRGIVSQECE